MTTTTWDVVVDGLQRLESPCIDLDGSLCFSDIAGDGAIYRLGSDDTLEIISTPKATPPTVEASAWRKRGPGPRGGDAIRVGAVLRRRRVAVHTYVARERLGGAMRDPNLPHSLVAEHAVLWDHPVTGAPVLYVNPWMTTEILDMGQSESRNLLQVLLSYVSDPAVEYRHEWRRGDFIVWDNIALLHGRATYDPAEPRLLFRIQLGLP